MANHELSFTPQEALSSTPKTPEKIGGNFVGKDIISLKQFDKDSINTLFKVVPKMKDIYRAVESSDILEGTRVVSIFFEPSTRTRGTFEAAITQLGGQFMGIDQPKEFSSMAKGEDFEDSMLFYEMFGDAIIIRHPDVGAAQRAADVVRVPVINAGDGIGEHPTQALLDLYTIKENAGKLGGLTGLMAGDIKNGRTVHSLLDGLSLYPDNTIYLLSPDLLKLEPQKLNEWRKKGLKIEEIENQSDIPKDADFWYWTRVQRERFKGEEEYKAVKNQFVLNEALVEEKAGTKTIFMHPMPRVGEIDKGVDRDPRAVYLTSQPRNGIYTRMALMALVLGRIRPY